MRTQWFAERLLKFRVPVLASLIVITAAMAFFAKDLRFDSAIEIWFLDNDPDVVTYNEFSDEFGADEIGVIGVFAEDVFQPEVLELTKRLTSAAEQVPHQYRVRSLTNATHFDVSEDTLAFPLLMPRLPQTGAEVEALRFKAQSSPLIQNLLVAADSRASAIIIELERAGNTIDGKRRFTEALEKAVEIERERIAKEKLPVRIELAGTPIFDNIVLQYNNRDLEIAIPLMVALVLLMGFVVFRNWVGAFFPLIVVVVSGIWSFGMMGLLGFQMTMVSGSLSTLILAIGVADSVHVLTEYFRLLRSGKSRHSAIVETIHCLLVPCFFTSATTAAGLFSLMISDLVPIREFAIIAGVGSLVAFVLSMTLLPLLLSFSKVTLSTSGKQASAVVDGILTRWSRFSLKTARITVVASVILVVFSLWRISLLSVGVNPMSWFPDGDPAQESIIMIDQRLGGSTTLEFFIDAPDEGFKDPEFLGLLQGFQLWLEKQDGITNTLSVVDTLKELNRALNNGDDAYARIPDTRSEIAQLFLLLEEDDGVESFLGQDYEVGRLSARAIFSEGDATPDSLANIEKKVEQLLASYNSDSEGEATIKMTGYVKLMSKMQDYLLDSQIQSFALAFAVVSFLLFILLGSFKLGLLALIPNFTPIAVGLGFMEIWGINLDPGTVMIGCVAMGLVVDDTVHFLVGIKRRSQKTDDINDIIAYVTKETGRPIVITSLVLASSFCVMLLASFKPNNNFGMISAIIIMLAVWADLIFLSALLKWIRPKFQHSDASP